MNTDAIEIFEIFPWTKNFETGIELIDEQHKKLVAILNELAAHLANRSNEVVLNDIFEELAQYADYHFKSEEAIWSDCFKDDDWLTRHEETHASFLDDVLAIKENKENNSLDSVVYSIVAYLSKWLAFHILDTDKRMALVTLKARSGMPLEEAKTISSVEMNGSNKVIVETVLAMYETLSTRTLDLMREKSLRRQAEKALRESEERWQLILDIGTESLWDLDLQKNEIKEALSMLDFLRNDVNESSKIHPMDYEEAKNDLKEHLEGKSEFYVNKHRVIHENGSWSWIMSKGKVVSRDENDKPLRMIGTHSDITEKELANSIYKNGSLSIMICDANNRVIRVNPAFMKLTGYEEKEIIGKSPSFLASGAHDNVFYEEMWKRLNASRHWSGNVTNKKKNGETFTEFMDIDVITDSSGNVDHYIALVADVTEMEKYKKERQEQEAHLIQQSRMAQMGEMIAMIAHQWSQPLSLITSTTIGMRMALNFDEFDFSRKTDEEACKEKFGEKFTFIETVVGNLSSTMNDFRNFYNPNKILALTPLHAPVKKALQIIGAALRVDSIEVQEKYDERVVVNIRENEIIQVVLSVIKNAQDNFNEKKIRHAKISVSTQKTNGVNLLKICDNGGGIKEEHLEKIFEPYFTTKSDANGTGLGLHMCKIILESHNGGKIYAKNTENGTCFYIET